MAPPGERTMKVGLSFSQDINIPVFVHSRVHSCAPARPSGCQNTQPLALRSRLFSGEFPGVPRGTEACTPPGAPQLDS